MDLEVCDVPLLELSLKPLNKLWFDREFWPILDILYKSELLIKLSRAPY